MNWYDSIFRDEAMCEVDPFGYGMGLAIGYVIIPDALLALAICLIVAAWRVHRR